MSANYITLLLPSKSSKWAWLHTCLCVYFLRMLLTCSATQIPAQVAAAIVKTFWGKVMTNIFFLLMNGQTVHRNPAHCCCMSWICWCFSRINPDAMSSHLRQGYLMPAIHTWLTSHLKTCEKRKRWGKCFKKQAARIWKWTWALYVNSKTAGLPRIWTLWRFPVLQG